MLKTFFLFNDSAFFILGTNIIAYITTLLFLFLLFSIIDSGSLKYVSLFSIFSGIPSFRFFFIICILSLCGIPPLFGFFAKLFIFINLFNKFSYFFLCIFFFFNLFAMYFYLQNTRYLVYSSHKKIFRISLNSSILCSKFTLRLVMLFTTICFFFIYLDFLTLFLNNFFL